MNNLQKMGLGILLTSSIFTSIQPIFAKEITTSSQNFSSTEIAAVPSSPSGFPQADSVSSVTYPGGVFVQSGSQWVETNGGGAYYFQETHRDQWSIYLRATDRNNVNIQLDLWTEQVKYNGSFLYQIIDAR